MRELGLKDIDNKMLHFCSVRIRNVLFDRSMPIITRSNDYGQVYIILSLIFILIAHRTTEGVNIIIALAFGAICGEGILKHIVKRNRPVKYQEQDNYLISKPKSFSFPSGHTTSSFAVLGVLWYMNSDFKYLVLFIAVLVSFSRLYLYVHYPTDVIAGIILGLICAKAALFATNHLSYDQLICRLTGYINGISLPYML